MTVLAAIKSFSEIFCRKLDCKRQKRVFFQLITVGNGFIWKKESFFKNFLLGVYMTSDVNILHIKRTTDMLYLWGLA